MVYDTLIHGFEPGMGMTFSLIIRTATCAAVNCPKTYRFFAVQRLRRPLQRTPQFTDSATDSAA